MPKKLYLFIHFLINCLLLSQLYILQNTKKCTQRYRRQLRRGQISWSSQYLGVAAILVRGRSVLMTAMDTTVPSQKALPKISNKYLTRYKNLCKTEQENKNLKLSGAPEN